MELSQKTKSLASTAYNSRRQAASAAGLARHISKLLKQAGFVRCDKLTEYKWTEGFTVDRVGCSSEIAINWYRSGHTARDREICHEREAEMKAFLTSRGWYVDPRNWIDSTKPKF